MEIEKINAIENELKLMIYTKLPVSPKVISDARTLRMISFIGCVKSNKKVIDINDDNTHELYFMFDRFIALEFDDYGDYQEVWNLYPHEVESIDKMILDAEKLAGFL